MNTVRVILEQYLNHVVWSDALSDDTLSEELILAQSRPRVPEPIHSYTTNSGNSTAMNLLFSLKIGCLILEGTLLQRVHSL